MPRQNSPERRAQIVDAFMSTMAEHGYEEASVKRIALKASLTPGLLHYHFARKQDILIALCDQLVAGVWARLDATPADSTQPRDALALALEALLAITPQTEPRTVRCWAFLGSEALKSDEVASVYQSYIAVLSSRVRTLVANILDSESRSQRELPALAAAIVAATEGFVRVGAAAPGAIPTGSAARTLTRMAFGLIDAQPTQVDA